MLFAAQGITLPPAAPKRGADAVPLMEKFRAFVQEHNARYRVQQRAAARALERRGAKPDKAR